MTIRGTARELQEFAASRERLEAAERKLEQAQARLAVANIAAQREWAEKLEDMRVRYAPAPMTIWERIKIALTIAAIFCGRVRA